MHIYIHTNNDNSNHNDNGTDGDNNNSLSSHNSDDDNDNSSEDIISYGLLGAPYLGAPIIISLYALISIVIVITVVRWAPQAS